MAFDPALDALLLALREAKLAVGVAETLRLKQWLSLEPALDLHRLGRLVACIAVRSRTDREVFDRIYQAWLEQVHLQARTATDLARLPRVAETPAPAPEASSLSAAEADVDLPPPGPAIAEKQADGRAGEDKQAGGRTEKANPRRIRTGILAMGIVGAMIAGAFVALLWLRPPPVPENGAPANDAAPDAPNAPDAATGPALSQAVGTKPDGDAAPLKAIAELRRLAEQAIATRPDGNAATPDAGAPDANLSAKVDVEPDLPIPDTRKFRAFVPEFTVSAVEDHTKRDSPWLHAAFAAIAIAVAAAVWFSLRKRSWLRAPETPPLRPGPPDVSFSPPALRGPVLLGDQDREALVWGIGRFVTDRRTTRLDVQRSVLATAAAGGIPTLRFHFEGQYRSVWLWVDEGTGDPLLGRLASEISSVLTQSGLPVERATFWGIPDKLFTAEGEAFAATELDERRGSAVVALLTDGRRLSIHYDAPERRLRIDALLRSLSHWPKLAFVDFSDGRAGLDSIVGAHDIPVIPPEGIAAYLTEGIAPANTEPVEMELAGDPLAWVAACALAPRPVDEATAIALQKALDLKVTPWTLRALQRESSTAAGCLDWTQPKRAQWLRWLKSASGDVGVDDENPVPAGSLLGRALKFWRAHYDAEGAKRSKEENERGAPWKNTPAEHRWRMERALLDLWDKPDDATQVLYDLSRTDTGEIIRHTLRGYTSLEYQSAQGARELIILPWRRDKRSGHVRVMLQELEFGAALTLDRREVLRRPGRLGLSIGLAGGLAISAAMLAGTQLAPAPSKPPSKPLCDIQPGHEGAWCDVAANQDGRFSLTAIYDRMWATATPIDADMRVSVTFAEVPENCEQPLQDKAVRLFCGRLLEPRRPAVWWHRRSIALIQASPRSPYARKVAARLLDTGSVQQAVIAEAPANLGELFDPLSFAIVDQMIVIAPSRDVLSAPVVQRFQGSLALLVEDDLKHAAALLGGDGLASAPAVWPHVEIVRGAVETAAVPTCPDGMVLIQGATFMMGSPEGKGEADEHPAHKVQLSPYCMDKTEVTVAQYRACVETTYCKVGDASVLNKSQQCNWNKEGKENHPINCVDWREAEWYCRWAGGALPTEAQWEFAARGTDGREYPWGNEAPGPTRLNACGAECAALDPHSHAMYEGNDGWPGTAPVGTFEAGASPFGMLDMAGNVSEWTADWHRTYEQTENPLNDPTNSALSNPLDMRAVRGGGWNESMPAEVRTARRTPPQHIFEEGLLLLRSISVGFRCASVPGADTVKPSTPSTKPSVKPLPKSAKLPDKPPEPETLPETKHSVKPKK